jgi:hypothetical protein
MINHHRMLTCMLTASDPTISNLRVARVYAQKALLHVVPITVRNERLWTAILRVSLPRFSWTKRKPDLLPMLAAVPNLTRSEGWSCRM